MNQDKSAPFRGVMTDLSHIESQLNSLETSLDRLKRILEDFGASNTQQFQAINKQISQVQVDVDDMGELIGEMHEKTGPMAATIAQAEEMGKKFGPAIMAKFL